MLQQNGNAQETVAGLEVAADVPGDDAQKEATTAPPHQSFFDDLRLRDCLIVLGLLLVLMALVDRELHDEKFAKSLADRPLLSASLFTILLSAMAYGGWNAVRAHWEAEKWRKLSSLAMVSMAYDITVVIDTCIWLVVGVKPFSSFTPSDAAHDKLTRIRTDKKCPQITDQDYGKINSGIIRNPLRARASRTILDGSTSRIWKLSGQRLTIAPLCAVDDAASNRH